MDDLHINPVEKCDKCGHFTVDYEVREYGYDSATGYTDTEIICVECAAPPVEDFAACYERNINRVILGAELSRLDREVERGVHSLPVLSGDPWEQLEAVEKSMRERFDA